MERRALLDQRIDALARVALGELDGRLHRQRWSRRLVDDEAEEAIASLAPTWAAFMNTMRCAGCPGDSASMMSFM
jgi:hypothetical protein